MKNIITELKNHVLSNVIDREPKLNALNIGTMQELNVEIIMQTI